MDETTRSRWSPHGLTFVIVTFLLVAPSSGLNDPTLPPGLLYPFGADVGDEVVVPEDDGYAGPIKLSTSFPLKNESYTQLYVSNNGLISFWPPATGWYNPRSFPMLGVSNAMVAPYWADSDVSRNTGRTYFREVTDDSPEANVLLARATADVQRCFANLPRYEAKWLFICTWHNVTFAIGGTSTSRVNTFQAVFVSDFEKAVVMFNYGKLTWTSGGVNGTGATGAQAGYNTGYDQDGYYEALPESLTNNVLKWANMSNVDWTGRWAFIVGEISNALGCYADAGGCPLVYQQPDPDTGACIDVAPAFDCPIFEGPYVISRTWFEFSCTVNATVTDAEAVFEVTFLFNGLPSSDVPPFIATAEKPNVRLHEMYLSGHIGQSLSCAVNSYWALRSQVRSRSLTTKDYFLGIQVSTRLVSVTERDYKPKVIQLKSTLPITCHDIKFASAVDPCELELTFNTTENIGERQRIVGKDPRKGGLRFVFKETDWKDTEKLAYSNDTNLEIIARVDPPVYATRENAIRFNSVNLPRKWYNGSSYTPLWNGYKLSDVTVLQEDTYQGDATCRVTADPHFVSFDGEWYDMHLEGIFIYATRGIDVVDFQVQVHQRPCSRGSTVACACGVGVIDNTHVMVYDLCDQSGIPKTPCIECETEKGCSLTTNGWSFKMQSPSGIIVDGKATQRGSASYIDFTLVIPKELTREKIVRGICGTADGDKGNEVWNRHTGQKGSLALRNGVWYYPDDFAWTWWVKDKCEQVFSPCYKMPAALDVSDEDNKFTYCQGNFDKPVCGSYAVSDTRLYQATGWQPACRKFEHDHNCGCRKSSELWEPIVEPDLTSTQPFTWPTFNDITKEEANATCWSLIVNEVNLGPTCLAIAQANIDMTSAIVEGCVIDVLYTGDFVWARDKVSVLQTACLFEILSGNFTDVNDTEAVIKIIAEETKAIAIFICDPFDCSGHGQCVNGSCNCDTDYVGDACAVHIDAVPVINQVLVENCDIRYQDCAAADMAIQDVAGTPDLTCKFSITTSDDTNKIYIDHGFLTSPTSMRCNLPPETLVHNSHSLNFSSLHEPKFDFSCIYPGSWETDYVISVSNDGRVFSNEVHVKVFDSLCMNCDNSSCVLKGNTCLINGYCFDNQQPNPYLPNCQRCEPGTSNSTWTKASELDSCAPESFCSPGSRCHPLPDFNVTCVPAPCQLEPCQNGGTCSEFDGEANCLCSSDYTGALCDVMAPCQRQPCQNGGTCSEHDGEVNCLCSTGYTGDLCDVLAPCQWQPCQNGGTCSELDGEVNCLCSTGYTGALCEDILEVRTPTDSNDDDVIIGLAVGLSVASALVVTLSVLFVLFYKRERVPLVGINLQSSNQVAPAETATVVVGVRQQPESS